MCGIFGFSTQQTTNVAAHIHQGLRRLEYRGYDSWGIAVTVDGNIDSYKQVGSVPEKPPFQFTQSRVGIGHTRWATHGGVTQANAHPHVSQDSSFCLVHNGIVENYQTLKQDLLAQGRVFVSETDTEVLVGLIEAELRGKTVTVPSLIKALKAVYQAVTGRNTIAVLTNGGDIVAVRNGSPLVIGRKGTDVFLASDALSFAEQAQELAVIENGQLVSVNARELAVRWLETGLKVDLVFKPIEIASHALGKDGYEHYMLKEIHETPQVLRQVASTSVTQLEPLIKAIRQARHVYAIGSGTSGIAAAQIAYYLRTHAKIHATELIGAEAGSYLDLFSESDLIIAPSQSGETADVLEVLEAAKAKGVAIASYVNMPGSMMAHMSDYAFEIQAGAEVCVLSTKVFSAMQAWGFLLAKAVAGEHQLARESLKQVEKAVIHYLANDQTHAQLKQLANYLSQKEHLFLLSKGQHLAVVMEGMVKLVEASYRHAHAIAAGDLKHYAITLMEPGVPVVFVLGSDAESVDITNAIHEVKARGATTIVFSPNKKDEYDQHITIPDLAEASAIAAIIPLQLLAYYLAVALGNPVDKPRNIAKSVTVK